MSTTPTPLAEGDILRIGTGYVRWQVVSTFPSVIVRNPRTGASQPVSVSDIHAGTVTRWNRVPITSL
jgi:hypothetical protein